MLPRDDETTQYFPLAIAQNVAHATVLVVKYVFDLARAHGRLIGGCIIFEGLQEFRLKLEQFTRCRQTFGRLLGRCVHRNQARKYQNGR